MRKIFYCLILFFISIKIEAQIDYSGNYGFQSKVYIDKDSEWKPNKDELDQGRMGELTLFKIDSVKYKFWLSANRGWPSYNQGNIDGIIDIKRGKAVFKVKQDYSDSSCVIVFVFNNNYLEVEQRSSDSDCGFGMNVYADGKYKRRGIKKIKNAGLEDLYTDFTKYEIISGKAFLFEDGSGDKMKKPYFIKGDNVLSTAENDNYVYVEYISASGKFIYGWIKKSEIKIGN